jgi:NDP-sugar pyrophosphorylase family protein
MVHGLIFCAGLGTRLKPLTDTMPKALVPIAGKPLLQWQVERLRDAGITDSVINVHHFPDQIIDAIRSNNGWGCNIRISDERDRLLDTGGGLRKAGELLGEGLILACNVDILSNIDIRALIAAHNPQNIGTLVVSDRKTQRYLLFDDTLTLRGWTNIATGEVKPDFLSSIANYRLLAFSGMQVLSPAIFNHMDRVVAQKGDKFSLIDLYLSVCEQDRSTFNIPNSTLSAFIPEDYRMMDVGKIDQIDEAERFAETLYTKK